MSFLACFGNISIKIMLTINRERSCADITLYVMLYAAGRWGAWRDVSMCSASPCNCQPGPGPKYRCKVGEK